MQHSELSFLSLLLNYSKQVVMAKQKTHKLVKYCPTMNIQTHPYAFYHYQYIHLLKQCVNLFAPHKYRKDINIFPLLTTPCVFSHLSSSEHSEKQVLFMVKGKGIRFIVLYPPKCSHDLPPLAGTVHTETISIPQGIFQSNWQHIAHTL